MAGVKQGHRYLPMLRNGFSPHKPLSYTRFWFVLSGTGATVKVITCFM
jgi:hypothetical protein